jgi:hypothetical protein
MQDSESAIAFDRGAIFIVFPQYIFPCPFFCPKVFMHLKNISRKHLV